MLPPDQLAVAGIAVAAALVILQLVILVLLVARRGPDLGPVASALEALEKGQERAERAVREESARGRDDAATHGRNAREEVAGALGRLGETLTTRLGTLTDANERRLDALRSGVEQGLTRLREDNARSLELMRHTVDEKLQGTLEKRLGESFRLVSERLEQVHKGLGEMQSLATGVGDLKRVLTNVKTRGTWGEIQLGALLAEILSPDQYEANVATKPGAERVEFAIKLPGPADDPASIVWIPIDAKYPIEDFQRLVDAQERADPDAAEAAARQLEARIRGSAADIATKYLCPPRTTDFGIMFLPTEGLYAEVIRRNGLVESLQRERRVVIAGPITLSAILNSLQMGFRTLAIQKRSSEVWSLLAAVKTEFGKYGDVLAKVQRKLEEASTTIDGAATRTRAIERKLRDVQELPGVDTSTLLPLGDANGDTDDPARSS